MAERPDLEAIRVRLHKAKSLFPDRPYPPRTFHQQVSDTAELLTYCRDLEAENKRLQDIVTAAKAMRSNMDGHYVPAEDIWLFDGACEDSV